MNKYEFNSASEGHFLKAILCLKEKDPNLNVIMKKDISPFESDMIIRIEMEADYEKVLARLSNEKTIEESLLSIRPIP